MCQKSGEISLLKQQLRDSQGEVGNKLNEIVSLKASLREFKNKIEELEQKNKEHEEALRQRCAEIEVWHKNHFEYFHVCFRQMILFQRGYNVIIHIPIKLLNCGKMSYLGELFLQALSSKHAIL